MREVKAYCDVCKKELIPVSHPHYYFIRIHSDIEF